MEKNFRCSFLLMRRLLCWVFVLALPVQTLPAAAVESTASSPAASEPQSPSATAHIQYPPLLIGPGDLLNVTIFGEEKEALPTTFLVDSAGSIEFPLVGQVVVGGMTQVQASRFLASELTKYLKDPQVTVLVTDSAQYTVSVIGNVVKPGTYLIRGVPTLLGALSEAGGPLPHSQLDSVVLVRNNRSIKMPVGVYLDPSNGPQPQPLILPGDTVYVPLSPWPTLAEWGIIATLLSSAAVLADAVRNR